MAASSGKGNFPLTYVISVTGAEQTASKFGQVRSGIEGTSQAATPLNKNLATTQTNLDKTGKSAQSTGQKIGQSSGQINKTSTSVTDLGNSSSTTTKKTEGLAAKFQKNKGLIFGMTMLASGVIEAVGMLSSYQDAADKVSRVQDELNKVTAGGVEATESYQKALEKRNAAQLRVNDLTERGKTGTPAYTKAVRELKNAQDELNKITEGGIKGTKEYKDASNDLEDAQRGLRFMQRNMILSMTDLIPMSLLAASGFINMAQQIKEAKAAKLAATGATEGLTKSMKAMRIVMIALPIVAIAAALLAIKTNAFGFRDALDSLGKKLGEMFPPLKGLLQWIRDFATALGLAEKGMDLSKAWDLLVTGFQNALKQLQTTDWKAVINSIVTGISNFIKNFDWGAAWQSFKDALKSFSEWLDPILKDMGKFILDVIKTEGPKWWVGFQEALWATGAWIKTSLAQIGKEILNTIKTKSPEWWIGFQEALWASGQWIKTQLALVGKAILNYIKTEAANWWLGFQNALGASVTWVATQMAKIAKAIVNYDWAKTGTDIWNKIAGGIQGAFNAAGDFFGKLFSGQLLKGAEASGGEGGMVDLATAKNMMGIPQKPDIDITAAIAKLDQLKADVNTTTTQISAMFLTMSQSIGINLAKIPPMAQTATSNTSAAFVTMETSIKGVFTRLMAVFTPAFTPLPGLAMTATSQTSAAFVTMLSSITGTLTQVKTQLTTLQTAITALQTTTTASMTAMTTATGAWIKAATTSMGAFTNVLKLVQQSFSTLSTSVATYMSSMITNIGGFASKATSSFNTVNSAVKTTHNALSSMSTSVSTYMSSMSSKVNSFGSAAQSAFKKVESSAKSATSGVKQLQSAINSLKDKTVTITVRYRTVGGLEHGGAFFKGMAQHGAATSIVDRPTTFGGVRMGEGFKPEMVTVTPLTRGTGNHGGPTVSSGGGAGGGGSQPIINNITVVLDGRVIQRFVEKTALHNIGLQV